MPVPSSVLTLLLVTADPEIQALVRHIFKCAAITVTDAKSVRREPSIQNFDVMILEAPSEPNMATPLLEQIDLSRTLVVTGSRAVLKNSAPLMQLMNQQGADPLGGGAGEASLEGYLEMKMGDFVKGMRTGSARNLHPILISAVERPLITSALRETQGNQVQAAELLGLNRNTLRKKIVDLHIPLKRTRAKASRTP
jgi:DNA-binding protein Fis